MSKVIKWHIIYPDLIVLLLSLTNHPSLLIAHQNIIAFSYFLESSLKICLGWLLKIKTSIVLIEYHFPSNASHYMVRFFKYLYMCICLLLNNKLKVEHDYNSKKSNKQCCEPAYINTCSSKLIKNVEKYFKYLQNNYCHNKFNTFE